LTDYWLSDWQAQENGASSLRSFPETQSKKKKKKKNGSWVQKGL
jgi:hypothetical protein